MKHRDLLVAISEVDPVEVKGEFERHCSLRWDELRPSAAGGRCAAPRTFDVLYLGRPKDSVVAEAYRHLVDDELDSPRELAATVLERRILTCNVAVKSILDLRSTATRSALALTTTQLFSEVGDYDQCQAIGAAAHQLGLFGVIAPSASRLGETLALFTTNLPVEQWPIVKSRDIWRGLPADPRRLRSVEETA